MLTLLLLRHAKAEPSGRGDDFSRDLTEKGKRDAGEIGAFLADRRLMPSVALVSAAKRTSRTYELVAARLGVDIAVHIENALYNAGEGRIRDRLGLIAVGSREVIVVGHNPGIMEAAVAMAQQGDLAEIERLRGRFPPCGLAVLSFDAEDWSAACASGGRLDALVFPEDLSG